MKLFKRTISILLGISLLFCIFIYYFAFTEKNSISINNEDKLQIIEMLKENNIRIEKEIIPDKFFDAPEITLYNQAFTPVKFSEKIRDIDGAAFKLSGNVFTITFSKPYAKKDFLKASPEIYGNVINKVLSKLGFLDVIINLQTEKGYAEVFKSFNHEPIFSDCFKVYFNDRGIYKIEGLWFEILPDYTYKKHTPIKSVFLKIANDKNLSGAVITDITTGYISEIPKVLTEKAIAVPVIRITVNNKKTYDYKI